MNTVFLQRSKEIKSQNTLMKMAVPDLVFFVCHRAHTDGPLGKRDIVIDVPRVAEI